ncbi:DUF4116 domain-containing protein [bacterium]|nr:DUF4116 domain-containing protein [bacterium]
MIRLITLAATTYAATQVRGEPVHQPGCKELSHRTPLPDSDRDRYECVLAAIQKDPHSFFLASNRLRSNEDLALAVISKDIKWRTMIKSPLREDRDFWMKVITQHPEYWPEISLVITRDNVPFAVKAIEGGYRDLSKFSQELLDNKEVAEAINQHADFTDVIKVINHNQKSYSFHMTIPINVVNALIKHIPCEKWSPSFTEQVMKHTPFVSREDVMANESFKLSDLLSFEFTFIETNPDQFLPQFLRDLGSKNIQRITPSSLYKQHTEETGQDLDTQQTLYGTTLPTVLIIPTDDINSGHNDLLQDRRWLGRKISDHVKIIVVGHYNDLTKDVQNRIDSDYIDEYSLQYQNKPSSPKTDELGADQLRYKQLSRITTVQALELDIITLEQKSKHNVSQNELVVVQSDGELNAVSSTDKPPHRYLLTRLPDEVYQKHSTKESDVVIYQYLSDFGKNIDRQLSQQGIHNEDTQKIEEYLKDQVIRIPTKPKLDIVANFKKHMGKWKLQYRDNWYQVKGIQTHAPTHKSSTPTHLNIVSPELLKQDYFNDSSLYMDNDIAREVFDALSEFATNDPQWLILEGAPGLGKDALTKHFLKMLGQNADNIHVEEITSAPDQPLLEQIVDTHEQHPGKNIVFQISEINLISPAQLNEIFHFIQGKNIKIIGTQNAQSQISNRFKLNEQTFSTVHLTSPTGKRDRTEYMKGLIDWASAKYEVPLKWAVVVFADLYIDENIQDVNNPPTPRQLILFAKKLGQKIQEEGLERAEKSAHHLLNAVFFRHRKTIQLKPVKFEREAIPATPGNGLPTPLSLDNLNQMEEKAEMEEQVAASRRYDSLPGNVPPTPPQAPLSPLGNVNPIKEKIQTERKAAVARREGSFLTLSNLNQMEEKAAAARRYDLIPGEATPKRNWTGTKALFLEYAADLMVKMSQIPERVTTPNTISATLAPGETLLVPSLMGSNQATMSLYNEAGYALQCPPNECEQMFDRKERVIFNAKSQSLTVDVTFDDPLPLYSELRSTPLFKQEGQRNLDILNEELIDLNDILKRFIHAKLVPANYTKESLLIALNILIQDGVSQTDMLAGIFTYFDGFMEMDSPADQKTGNLLYDSLYFQKGVCRHQAELGRIIFSALGFETEKRCP